MKSGKGGKKRRGGQILKLGAICWSFLGRKHWKANLLIGEAGTLSDPGDLEKTGAAKVRWRKP